MKNPTTLFVGIEAQYSYEFGLMMARRDGYWRRRDGCYLEQILYDSDSSECYPGINYGNILQ
jgi:hypothetical protein